MLRTILVVDDEETMRTLLEQTLMSMGYRVVTAQNGTRALEILKTQTIHLLISDVHMPQGNGLFLLHELRAPQFAHLPVIVMTGDAEQEPSEMFPGTVMLRKPFGRTDLAEKITLALRAK